MQTSNSCGGTGKQIKKATKNKLNKKKKQIIQNRVKHPWVVESQQNFTTGERKHSFL